MINQGRPKSAYFPIIQPVPGIVLKPGQQVICKNPKTNQSTTGIVSEHRWVFDWEDPPRGFLFGYWGVEPKLLRTALLQSDPGYEDPWFRIILIRETV